jgi:hypothetical protein
MARGISERTLYWATKAMGVVSAKDGFDGRLDVEPAEAVQS